MVLEEYQSYNINTRPKRKRPSSLAPEFFVLTKKRRLKRSRGGDSEASRVFSKISGWVREDSSQGREDISLILYGGRVFIALKIDAHRAKGGRSEPKRKKVVLKELFTQSGTGRGKPTVPKTRELGG